LYYFVGDDTTQIDFCRTFQRNYFIFNPIPQLIRTSTICWLKQILLFHTNNFSTDPPIQTQPLTLLLIKVQFSVDFLFIFFIFVHHRQSGVRRQDGCGYMTAVKQKDHIPLPYLLPSATCAEEEVWQQLIHTHTRVLI